jgi:hypothetical protein
MLVGFDYEVNSSSFARNRSCVRTERFPFFGKSGMKTLLREFRYLICKGGSSAKKGVFEDSRGKRDGLDDRTEIT